MCSIALSPASGYLHSYAYVPTQVRFLHTQLQPHGSPGSIAVSCVCSTVSVLCCVATEVYNETQGVCRWECSYPEPGVVEGTPALCSHTAGRSDKYEDIIHRRGYGDMCTFSPYSCTFLIE
jgi:hypothetical protein